MKLPCELKISHGNFFILDLELTPYYIIKKMLKNNA